MEQVMTAAWRPRRQKYFGDPVGGTPHDRAAIARIVDYAEALSLRLKTGRQHRGPLTRATIQVLEALLGFLNRTDGRCFPAYESIAAAAGCARSTVARAIKELEAAGILTWANRLLRVTATGLDLLGQVVTRSKLIRTSNAYSFTDPAPPPKPPKPPAPAKSENRTTTPLFNILDKAARPESRPSALEAALGRLGTNIAAKLARRDSG